jgi:hypothetical protein
MAQNVEGEVDERDMCRPLLRTPPVLTVMAAKSQGRFAQA